MSQHHYGDFSLGAGSEQLHFDVVAAGDDSTGIFGQKKAERNKF